MEIVWTVFVVHRSAMLAYYHASCATSHGLVEWALDLSRNQSGSKRCEQIMALRAQIRPCALRHGTNFGVFSQFVGVRKFRSRDPFQAASMLVGSGRAGVVAVITQPFRLLFLIVLLPFRRDWGWWGLAQPGGSAAS